MGGINLKLKEYLIKNKKSMKQLSNETNINRALISLHINGKKSLSLKNITKLKDKGIDVMEIAYLDAPDDIDAIFTKSFTDDDYDRRFIQEWVDYVDDTVSGTLYVFKKQQLNELTAYLDAQGKKYYISKSDFCWTIEFKGE